VVVDGVGFSMDYMWLLTLFIPVPYGAAKRTDIISNLLLQQVKQPIVRISSYFISSYFTRSWINR
jgi:hypothetical protein